MAEKVKKLEAEVAIAGGGPAGCTIAKELSKRGRKVILLEKGRDDDRFLGNGLGVILRLEKGFHLPIPLKRTQEGDTVILAKCLGGGTVLYAGAASKPSIEYWKRHGIDLPEDLIDEAMEECWVTLPPEEFIGPGTRRVWEAADGLGIPFEKQHRHVDFSKCRPGCEYCNNGCRRGAKWTAREFADEALKNGAILMPHTEVEDLIIDGGAAAGLRARGKDGQRYEVNANVVVCSAGGTHTARILQRSGFPEAGSWFCGDPTFFTFGFVQEGPGNGSEHSMTVGWHDEEHKVLFCSMISPYMSWHMQFLQDAPLKSLPRLGRFRQALGDFAKVSDDGVGRVSADGKISKTFTEEDQKRFEYSREINEKILVKAGCDPNDLHHSSFVMGHPSGTVRVGELLDTNLETSVKNLYCCDTGMFPEAPGMPPTLTIVVLAKRLARRLETITQSS
jgi:choline dehydrogenase-like flavoprotein